MSHRPQDRPDDAAAVRAQLGRRVRGAVHVVRRCGWGLPVVTEVPPVLPSGEPFPTRYWLTCPLAVRRVARREAAGGVREMERRAREEPGFGEALGRAHSRYATERDDAVPGDAAHRPGGGVGGSNGGVKCLHAHYADHGAGNDNPVGWEVAREVEPLSCPAPCVAPCPDGAARRDPGWREPPG